MDEVGARVHLKNINVPQNILDLEKKIEDIKVEKNRVVKSQKFEEAAALRDTEKRWAKTWKKQRRSGKKKQAQTLSRSVKKR
jgi:ATP-dependent Clp protease ATP-binding subunit ClpC